MNGPFKLSSAVARISSRSVIMECYFNGLVPDGTKYMTAPSGAAYKVFRQHNSAPPKGSETKWEPVSALTMEQLSHAPALEKWVGGELWCIGPDLFPENEKFAGGDMNDDGVTDAALVRAEYFSGDWHELVQWFNSLWRWDNYAFKKSDEKHPWDENKELWTISTGGWSDHEALLSALEHNRVFWWQHFYSYRTGGHYTFAFPK